MAASLPGPGRTADSPRPGPRPPGWRSRLTIVPAAVAAAAARAPARWHWEEEEGRAGCGECGARWELQAERRGRRLGGLPAEGGPSRGTPGPALPPPGPARVLDVTPARAPCRPSRCAPVAGTQGPGETLVSRDHGSAGPGRGVSTLPPRERCSRGRARVRGMVRQGVFLLFSCWFPPKGLDSNV